MKKKVIDEIKRNICNHKKAGATKKKLQKKQYTLIARSL